MAAYTTIDNPELYFQTKTYTGTGSSNAITLDGDENMQPDLIWIKNRAASADHRLFDAVRGASKSLISNNTDAEYDDTSTVMLSSFDSDGFTVVSHGNVNQSSNSYVAWCWKETADAGFDIVTFTGNQTARTISHSLSAKPKWLWIKNREKIESWHMQHGSLGAEFTAESNTSNAFDSGGTSVWNDTEPTTSVFSVSTNGNINETDSGIVTYLWAEKQGFSKFGTYTGNGNADGPFIYTGFRVAWLMVKRSDNSSAGEWIVFDNTRGANTYNPVDVVLCMSNSQTEADWGTNYDCDFTANGFKWRWNGSADRCNGSNNAYVFMAFAEAPFVNSNGVPCNAR